MPADSVQTMEVRAWIAPAPGEAMILQTREETPGPDEVLVEVAGCGVCHTDLGFFYEGVPTRHPFPLVLGHEISGRVVEAGPGAEAWVGRAVVVPAVIPCGSCPACTSGHGSVCPNQIFPGNDVHGGFASHVRVPATGLCPVPDLSDPERNPHGVSLASLSVIADAVSTPYQAIERAGLAQGALAVFVGAGGVGGFGVQIAAARGAHVIAIDTDPERLEAISGFGADLSLDASSLDARALKRAVRQAAKSHEIPSWRWRIFETSGHPAGQTTAFGLLGHASYLSLVGFTKDKVQVRLSNLMAFDATAQGNWGCLPEHYPAIVDMVLAGHVQIEPFIEIRPLHTINQTFEDIRAHRMTRRAVLLPEPP